MVLVSVHHLNKVRCTFRVCFSFTSTSVLSAKMYRPGMLETGFNVFRTEGTPGLYRGTQEFVFCSIYSRQNADNTQSHNKQHNNKNKNNTTTMTTTTTTTTVERMWSH
jgi:hypothetical protein